MQVSCGAGAAELAEGWEVRPQSQTCYMTVLWQRVPEARLCLGLLSCYLGTSWATNPVAKCSTQSGKRGSPSGFLIPKKLHYSSFWAPGLGTSKLSQHSLLLHLLLPICLHFCCALEMSFKFPLFTVITPPSPQPLFQHKTPWSKNRQQLPQPAAAG